MKKICMVAYSYYPFDVRIRKEAEALSEKGYSVKVICLKKENETSEEVVNNVSVKRIGFSIKRGSKLRYAYQYLKSYFLFKKELKKQECDIVHFHNPPDFLVFAERKRRIVLDIHDPMPELYLSRFKNKLILFVIKVLEKKACKHANKIITVSNACKRKLIERGTPSDKITIVMNVPDEKRFKTISKKTDGPFTLLYSGSMNPERGIDLVLKAVSQLNNVNLILVGKAEDKLVKMVKEFNIESRVKLTGQVPQEKVAKYISKADVCLIPWYRNAITEIGIPNKLFEYILMKKPIIAADTSAMKELMGNSIVFFKAGDLESFKESILRIKNKHFDTSKAYEIYEKIKWDKMKENLYSVYDSLTF